MSDRSRLDSLISLLDDESDQIACTAMIELLNYSAQAGERLAELQESNNPLLRQRVHQLQAIMKFRNQRREFAEKLKKHEIGLVDGLIETHLLWYDSDTREEVEEVWTQLLESAEKFNPSTIDKLAYFMRKCGFSAADKDEFQADYYCLGTVLDEMVGTDFILCSIALKIAERWGMELKVIRIMDNFALLDGSGKILLPQNGWQVAGPVKAGSYQIWDEYKLLKLAISSLFLLAVSSDSFRYISTIGNCLAAIAGEDNLDFLPYPYDSKAN
jgi:hypothetical protein